MAPAASAPSVSSAPSSFWSSLREWMRNPPWSLPRSGILVRVTNMGLGFVLMTLVVVFGATNTGNNGLYMLVSLYLGMLVVSGLVSRQNVERLKVTMDGPEEVFAGEAARFRLTLANQGRMARRALLAKIAGSSAPVLFARVEAGKVATRGIDLVFPRRGRRSIESILVYSGYPIGLFRKGRVHPVREERIVYPALEGLRAPPREERSADAGDPRLVKRGRSVEVRHLREAGDEDDRRDIHWPQTARQGRPIVKDRASEEGREAVVVLEGARPADAGPAWDRGFERAVSEAASLALSLLVRGEKVGVLAGGQLVRPATGAGQRRSILTTLALVEPGGNESGAASAPSLPPGAALYVVRVREDAEGVAHA